MPVSLDTIVSLCKRRGFIFQNSEVYGGLANTWDYGSLGVELKKNIKEAWWRSVVYEREDMEGLDSAIFMHPRVWQASGHLESFVDPLVDCRVCRRRFRADDPSLAGDEGKRRCPECGGGLTEPRKFNLMFKSFMGPVEDEASVVYLRPETAQGIFTNFQNIVTTMRRKVPFGIAQIGKAFRNEITPGNFIFRTREFEQMEIEYFVKPGTDKECYDNWRQERLNWYVRLGIKKDSLRLREYSKDELAHYALACTDIEFNFPMGWAELEGIANRGNFDLTQHTQYSGRDLSYHDDATQERYVPFVIEPSAGVDRAALAFLTDAYREETVKGEKRVVLGLHYSLAPLKVAVLPLLRNRPDIVSLAKEIWASLRGSCVTDYDDSGSIGRLYRRQDEIGTPFCLTVDVKSLEDRAVTVRERDSMLQDRVGISGVKEYLLKKLSP